MTMLTGTIEASDALVPITSEQELMRIEAGGPWDEILGKLFKAGAKYLIEHWTEVENGYLSVSCDH